MTETRIHPETGQVLKRNIREQTVRFGSLHQKVMVPGWYPDDDGDALHSGKDLAERNEIYKKLRAEYTVRIKAIRLKLRLSQEQAGRLIGGGPRAFQKYERGVVAPSEAAIGLLEVLARHPEAVRTLETVRAGTHADVEVAQEYDQERSFGGP
jgi:HTH-type transcriptional regulator/antitoxin MqsA